MQHFIHLIKKDILLEWRQRYAINGILLHVISSVFVVFLSVKVLNPPTWNALFWLILLFTSVSAVAKSFIAESKGRQLYYYGIASAQDIIISKTVFNILLMLVISIICLLVFMTLMGNPIQSMLFYIPAMLIGCVGFAATFTMLSSIASKSGNSNLLMPVLSFPIIIPMLLVLIKASRNAMDGLDPSKIWPHLLVLFAIDFIVIALAYILFPFLWKD
ncbi:MAG: heme exporter protein CcmB [Bacteroidota bacterium]